MNDLTNKLVEELVKLLPGDLYLSADGMLRNHKSQVLVDENGDVNFLSWHYGGIRSRFFPYNAFESTYLETEEDVDEFKKLVIDYFKYYQPKGGNMISLNEEKKLLASEFDRVIGFTGPKRAGKSTSSRELEQRLRESGYNVLTVSFATPIKSLTMYYEDITSVNKEDFRQVYQKVGDVCRDYDSNFFILSAVYEAVSEKQFCESDVLFGKWALVIDDVRYYNEAFICDELYYVGRSGIEYDEEHSSETRLSRNKVLQNNPNTKIFDVFIDNKGVSTWV